MFPWHPLDISSLEKTNPPSCSFKPTILAPLPSQPPLCHTMYLCNPEPDSPYIFRINSNSCKPLQKLTWVKLPFPHLTLMPFYRHTAEQSAVIFEQYKSAFLVHFFLTTARGRIWRWMACHSDLVGQILYFCVPIKILDQKSILSEIHVHGPWSFNAAEEVALGSIKAIILNLLYLLSSFHIVPVIFATCNT